MKVNKLHHSVSTSKLFSFDIFGHLTFKKVCVLAQKAQKYNPHSLQEIQKGVTLKNRGCYKIASRFLPKNCFFALRSFA